MKSKGIEISDAKGTVCIDFSEIISELSGGDTYYWSILFLWSIAKETSQVVFPCFQSGIFRFSRGLFVIWEDINMLARDSEQIIDLILIGSKDQNLLQRYEDDQEMFETCDIVLELVDGGFWIIFSKDEQFISRLANKFKEIKFLETDFLNHLGNN
jgi:hypothetical protein